MGVSQHLVSFTISCYFNEHQAYSEDHLIGEGQQVLLNAYLTMDQEFPVPVINLQLRSYSETVETIALRNREPGYDYQPIDEFEGTDDVDVDGGELPVTDKKDTTEPTREQLQYIEQGRRLNSQLSGMEETFSSFIMLMVLGIEPEPETVTPQTTELFEWVYSR